MCNTVESRGTKSVIETLTAFGLTLATAESLTGGGLCARLVDVPGASNAVRGGVCTYATDLKAGILGVPQALLDEYGPVHRDVAIAMAHGVRTLMRADLALSTTGVAGPGPADGHDAGTVHIALAWDGGQAHRGLHLDGDRNQIRQATIDHALALLGEYLEALTGGTPRQ